MKNKNLFPGIKDGIITDIKDVPSGLACNCYCPKCGGVLVAHKGEKNIWHFEHYNSEECEGVHETSIHLAAKQIIFEKKLIYLPKLYKEVDGYGRLKILDPKKNHFGLKRFSWRNLKKLLSLIAH